MRYGGVIGAIVLIWLLIGVLALWQRGYFKTGEADCTTAVNVALTVVAGPLNYAGVNPKVGCSLPQPSLPQPSSMPQLPAFEAGFVELGVAS